MGLRFMWFGWLVDAGRVGPGGPVHVSWAMDAGGWMGRKGLLVRPRARMGQWVGGLGAVLRAAWEQGRARSTAGWVGALALGWRLLALWVSGQGRPGKVWMHGAQWKRLVEVDRVASGGRAVRRVAT